MSPFPALLLMQLATSSGMQDAGPNRTALVPFVQRIELMSLSAEPRKDEPGARCTSRVSMNEFCVVVELTPDGNVPEGAARYTSAPILTKNPFRDLLVSWNVDCPELAGFFVELRVAAEARSDWSPWMYLGDWGTASPPPTPVVACDGGKIDTDYFRGTQPFGRAQLRLTAVAEPGGGDRHLVVRSLSMCASDRTLEVPYAPVPRATVRSASLEEPGWKKRLPVPFRSQRVESADIAGRICSPTSLAMLLARRREFDNSTREVADRAWDPVHQIYGNWPRNVQAAYSFGMRGYLTRFVCWRDVEIAIAEGQPIIASIAAKKGELTGAPYEKTDGHLLVVTGFDMNGDVCVNDPAAKDAQSGQTVYKRSEMQKVWLDRGGTAYVLLLMP